MTIVAIDGPAGAGKSTVARAVATELGFTYLDSGAMYRAVALAALQRGVEPAEIARLGCGSSSGDRVLLDGEDVTDAIRDARGVGGRLPRGGRPRGQARDGRPAAARARARRLGRRGPRHRHGRRARRRA